MIKYGRSDKTGLFWHFFVGLALRTLRLRQMIVVISQAGNSGTLAQHFPTHLVYYLALHCFPIFSD